MRMVPRGPTGLGHLTRGSVKDLSDLREYKPEPGFEDFDYNPHVEGAGEEYFEALSTISQATAQPAAQPHCLPMLAITHSDEALMS